MKNRLIESICTNCLTRIFTEKYDEKKLCSVCKIKDFAKKTKNTKIMKNLMRRINEASNN